MAQVPHAGQAQGGNRLASNRVPVLLDVEEPPGTPQEIRTLIRDMSSANVLWGAPRLQGELLKLGI